MQPYILLIIFLLPAIVYSSQLGYGNPVVIDSVPVTMMTIDIFDRIVVASQNNIFFYNTNGTRVHSITLDPSIQVTHIAADPHFDIVVALCNDSTVKLFLVEQEMNYTIPVKGDLYGIWVTDQKGGYYVTINSTWHTGNDSGYWSTLTYFNYQGIVSTYTVEFSIWDLLVNPSNGQLIFDNFVWNEPAVYIYTSDVNGVIAKINTTRNYGAGGLAVDKDNNIIAAEYGLDIYSSNGSFVKHLNCSNGYMIFSPQVYDGYITYLDFFNDGCKPFVQFIDYNGNKILKVPYADHPVYSYEWTGLRFTSSGDIVVNINSVIKVWTRL